MTGRLRLAFSAYAGASLAHYGHNATVLASYPGLPAWLTPTHVWLAWAALTLLGIGGYWAAHGRRRMAGWCAIAVYAALGFDGLSHYALAPASAHSLAMNATIVGESITATLLLLTVLLEWRRSRPAAAT